MKKAVPSLLLSLLLMGGCPTAITDSDPATPTSLGVTGLSVSALHLSWHDNANDETGFRVERSPNGSTGWSTVKDTSANTTTWDDAGLTPGTSYSYRVVSYSAQNDSYYSNVASASTDSLSTLTMIPLGVGDTPTFTMGDGTYGPGVAQTISSAYSVSKFEITNAAFEQFIRDGGYDVQELWTTNGWAYKIQSGWTEPGSWTDANFNGADQPVSVSWWEAVAFCNWRSVREGLTPAYDATGLASLSATGYRLPTEVEWEYAAAKGVSGALEHIYPFDDAWDNYNAVNGVTKTGVVGSKSPNGDTPQGIADLSGNVAEWCSDNYQADGDVQSTTDRYVFADDTELQPFVLRGGSYPDGNTAYFRAAYRLLNRQPPNRYPTYGFRVARR